MGLFFKCRSSILISYEVGVTVDPYDPELNSPNNDWWRLYSTKFNTLPFNIVSEVKQVDKRRNVTYSICLHFM